MIVLTFTLAVFASFVSLELAGRIKAATGRAQYSWLLAAGIAMGGGIWSMHFVAMIALELPFAVAYNLSLTALSLFIAVLVATGGLYTVFWHRNYTMRFFVAGTIMGLGIAAMHYTGMAALIVPAAVHYNIALVVLSVLIAIGASVAALWIAFSVEQFALKLGGAVLMGVAVAGMHFTGMAAATFLCGPKAGIAAVAPGLSSVGLAGWVGSITGIILLMGLALAFYDRRAKRLTWATFVANESKRRIDALLRNAADLIAIVDRSWIVTYLSPAIDHLAGSTGQLKIGSDFLALFEPAAHDRAVALLETALQQPGKPVRDEFRGQSDAAEEWFELTLNDQLADLAIQGTIVNLRDITAQKQATKQIEQALHRALEATRIAEEHALALGEANEATHAAQVHALALEQAHEQTRLAEEHANMLARHDALTGLPNRRVFSADLQAALTRAQTGDGTYSLLLIDLDEFKRINDLQGHLIGDTVLCEIARRLEATMRKNDTVARLGGDEFAIIAEGDEDLQLHLDGAMRLAQRLLGAIRQPILIADNRVEIGASIGIASCREDATDVVSLLRAADIAMYRAKQNGRGTFRFFEQSMDDEMREQEAIEKDLIKAVAAEEIVPYYQPLVDIVDNRIRGFEALARWHHPKRGFIPPDVFIPIVEQLGLMTKMTESVLRQACRDARMWPEDIRIAVNVSPSELKDPMLPTRILTILAQEGLSPARLEVEITETALVSDISTAKTILNALQGCGITICLDDFGTGYSSLFHLRELKFDKVKIDRSFVQAMQENIDSEKIIDAILSLTRSLNLPTVAEGIENPAVLRDLVAKGCEYGQGYHFGKAMTANNVRELLKTGFDMELTLEIAGK